MAFNPFAWAMRGTRVYADKLGNGKKGRTNLIMALSGKTWLAPVLFTGSCNGQLVEEWLENHLIPELTKPSIIICDNAPFHRKKILKTIAAKHGHHLLFLPPYSPDFNPIEKVFALIKRYRLYNPLVPLESILVGKY
jgi:transposase